MATAAEIYVENIPESRRRAAEKLPLSTTVQQSLGTFRTVDFGILKWAKPTCQKQA